MIVEKYKLFKGDLAIVISPPKLGEYMDGILRDSVELLGDRKGVLGYVHIEDTDKLIYLCGHGTTKSIGKRSVSEIAKLLVESGYKGIQTIHITSCDSCLADLRL